MNNLHVFLLIIVSSLVTIAIRFAPFLFFRNQNSVPKWLSYLGATLPCAVMGMLVVYCLKDISVQQLSGWLPSLISCVIVALLQIWKKNNTLSILFGTVCYMLLVQFVF